MTSALDDYMQSWFQYVVTIMGAAAAVHLMLDRPVTTLFAKVDGDRYTSLAGLIIVLSVGGLAFGTGLAATGRLTLGTIVLVLATALVISGVRYASRTAP